MAHGEYDAIVLGGGFYGVSIANYLRTRRGLARVLIVEREEDLLMHASYNNQARVHNGYHYPRSYTTAYRSRINFPRFVNDFRGAVVDDFVKLYAIARANSKVAARQFERFCREIGADIKPAPDSLRDLFNSRLIEAVYEVREFAFDAGWLRQWARQTLNRAEVEVLYGTRVTEARQASANAPIEVVARDTQGHERCYSAATVFNCTYSGLNQIAGVAHSALRLKHELTEMALVELPDALGGVGITVMDGSFFSVMPFPDRHLYTLSHVRYTPHFSWVDAAGDDPYQRLSDYERSTHYDRMVRDCQRFVPLLGRAVHRQSLFEVKTVLQRNEGDDGRPILFERATNMPAFISILGGKIDNIYDVLERLDVEPIARGENHVGLSHE